MTTLSFDDVAYHFYENNGDAAAGDSTQYGFSERTFGHFTGFEAFSGTVSTTGDEDWVKLLPGGNNQYCLTVIGTGATPLLDPEILLYDSTGALVATSPLVGTSDTTTKFFGLASSGNTYYVSIASASGAGIGDYTFAVDAMGGYFTGHLVNRDIFDGTANADIIFGYGGPDDLGGGQGNDTIFGGAGDDEINAGSGNDLIYGGAGDDYLLAGSGDDTVLGGAGNDEILGVEGDDILLGRKGNDTLAGGANSKYSSEDGNDLLRGGDGDDLLLGEWGNDTLIGGAGADTLDGGFGEDFADYSGATRALGLTLAFSGANTGGAEGDQLTSIEIIRGTVLDDSITGNQYRNVLRGNDGNDTISGGAGTDRLIGGRGDDVIDGGTDTDRMTGGEGADVFVFRAGDGDDIITDFTTSEDVLRITGSGALTVTTIGLDTLINYGTDDSITLQGVQLALGDISFDLI